MDDRSSEKPGSGGETEQTIKTYTVNPLLFTFYVHWKKNVNNGKT